MSEKIIVGPFNKGLRNDRPAFMIDDDSFPTLINAYQWRGRIKRKRGTSILGRLRTPIGTTNGAGNLTVTISPAPISSGIVSFIIGTDVFVDGGGANPVTLTTNSTGSAVLDRTTGVLTITGSIALTSVIYYPSLPVLGLEELALDSTQFPGTLGFDTTYSYNIITDSPYDIYSVSFYKNLASATYIGYVQKGTWTNTSWNGKDYQQYWTANYQGALWTTNGINVPFSPTNVGMQFKTITAVGGIVAGPPAFATITTSSNHGLVIGDFVFINEITGMTGINFQTGYVTALPALNQITVEFPNATFGGAWVSGGIVQYLTNRSDTTKDCLRWYDGDPTASDGKTFVTGKGWVNFMPPLSQSAFSVAELPALQYYLVGARIVVPFKDRLLFLGPVVQASSGNAIYLSDTIVYSQNGTPFYTCSFTGNVDLASTVFNELLVPASQTATARAYFEDQTGFGGFVSSGLNQQIITCSSNEDVLIVGFNTVQTKLVYTGNDIQPFLFYLTNSELGSGSTFSAVNMDEGVLSRGTRGYIISNQTQVTRIDPEIPDEVFEINLIDHGNERFCAQRDFINEWIYFTYPANNKSAVKFKFPNTTLQYNYKDNSWALFRESYTTYGSFKISNGLTWANAGRTYPTWDQWNNPWDSGASTVLQPKVIAGNQQGFIVFRDQGTGESDSLYIQGITGSTVTSPAHNLSKGDYITISGALGSIGSLVNNKIFSIGNTTVDTFVLNPSISTGTYSGGGFIKRMYVPFIQTKQFPVAWEMARKTRLGPQQYLLTTTDNSQITLLIYLSQDSSNPYNDGPIVPSSSTLNDSLIYSTVLYTCPESTNLGLTAANTNLLQLTSIGPTGDIVNNQSQIWHRINTSLIGDTVQLGFTLSDDQMRTVDSDGDPISQFSEIELMGFILDVSSSMVIA